MPQRHIVFFLQLIQLLEPLCQSCVISRLMHGTQQPYTTGTELLTKHLEAGHEQIRCQFVEREIIPAHVDHSQRAVGEQTVLRLHRPLSQEALSDFQRKFHDILKGPVEQMVGALPAENGEFPDLPRLVLPFNRVSYGRLRQLIDSLNRA